MEEIIINRTGAVPLKFRGKEIAFNSNKWLDGCEQNRYHEVTVYETAGGKIIVVIEYITLWQSESNSTETFECQDYQEVITILEEKELSSHIPEIAEKLGVFEEIE